jgi:DNA-directed RNA polymerase subunit L
LKALRNSPFNENLTFNVMLSSTAYASLSLTNAKFEISLAKSVLIMIYIHNMFFFAWMEVQIGDLTKKEANLSILGGDIGVMYIIQDELLKSSSTQFAGVIARHPLADTLYMRVVSNNPLKDIIKATNTVIEGATELKKLLASKIKVK